MGRAAGPTTCNFAEGFVLPIPTLPFAFILKRSVPSVVTARLFAAGKKRPVLISFIELKEAALALPSKLLTDEVVTTAPTYATPLKCRSLKRIPLAPKSIALSLDAPPVFAGIIESLPSANNTLVSPVPI